MPRECLCQLCGQAATFSCSGCSAFFYCTRAHQVSHWKLQHHEECDRMSQHMAEGEVLRQFPFEYTDQVTQQVEYGMATECSTLTSWGVHGEGVWGPECPCGRKGITPSCVAPGRCKELPWLCLGSCEEKPETSALDLDDNKLDWSGYYTHRRLPLSSPVALLLTTPLTIYWLLRRYFYTTKQRSFPHDLPPTLVLHVLGPQRELEQFGVFRELSLLLPNVDLQVHLIGPDVPLESDGHTWEWRHASHCEHQESSYRGETTIASAAESVDEDTGATKKRRRDENEKEKVVANVETRASAGASMHSPPAGTFVRGRLRVYTHSGMYHEVCDATRSKHGIRAPHMVFAPNAGLAAYPSWVETLRTLAKPGMPPSFFTDFCREAALLGTRLLEALEVEVTHPITVNPFRRPFSESTSDNALPSYSNGFLFGINALWHDKAEGDNDHEREAETTKDDSHTEPLTGETK